MWAKRPVAPAQCQLDSAPSTGMYRRGGPKQSGSELAGLAKKKKSVDSRTALKASGPYMSIWNLQGYSPHLKAWLHWRLTRSIGLLRGGCAAKPGRWALGDGRRRHDDRGSSVHCKVAKSSAFQNGWAQQAPRGAHGERTVQSNGQDLLSASTSSSAKRYEASLPTLWETLSPLHSAPRTRLVDAWPDKTRRKKFSALAR